MTGFTLALAVAVAGGAGAALRHLVDQLVPRRDRFPWALLLVNATGSFCLGLLVSSTADQSWHAAVGTGLLGGYTTFSSASLDAAIRWVDSGRADAMRSATVMALACILSAVTGVAIGR
ncbi:fluoride efflux transporter FluC [Aeromicrobium sp. Sec7.5]|uniref:fluoride efflux transporter FluC n=1 Tax=Aeromicrobium sp. Sec7.5 TaxID=3121276 RepID=UPI002FE4C630